MYTSPARRAAGPVALALLFSLAACGGDAETMDASVDDVDAESSLAATDEEISSFSPPADSVLNEEQVTAYLKTSLLQFDLVRKESDAIREDLAKMDARKDGGALSQLRNVVDAGSMMARSGDVLAGSYVRSARTLGYNPAEMEWVQERMSEISGHLMMKPMLDQSRKAAAELRAEAEEIRAKITPGTPEAQMMEEQVKYHLSTADEMDAAAQVEVERSIARNLEVLRAARPAVGDDVWTAIGMAGGTSGLVALAGLDRNDPEMQRKLDEFRAAFQAALENRAAPVPTPTP